MLKISFYQNIGPGYLHRFRLFPMIEWRGEKKYPPCNLFLHIFKQSDDERCLHDHPWPSWSVLIWGDLQEFYYYVSEHFRMSIAYRVGHHRHRDIPRFKPIYRPAEWRHRLILRSDYAVTLFAVGFKQREWGFWPAGKFVPWRKYLGLDSDATVD